MPPLRAAGIRPAGAGGPDRDRQAVVAGFLPAYAVVHTGLALRYGERWFDRGDALEVYSELTSAWPRSAGSRTGGPAPGPVAVIQIAAVLAGDVVAVAAAHDRSIALLPVHRRIADQVPLVLLTGAYTMPGPSCS